MSLPVKIEGYPGGLIELLNREGEPFTTKGESSFTSFTTPTGSGTLGPSGFGAAPLGRAIYVKSVYFWSTTPIAARWQLGNSPLTVTGGGNNIVMDTGFAVGANQSVKLDIDQFARSSLGISAGLYINRWLDSAVSGTHYVGAGAVAWSLADSINLDAKRVFLMLSDSTWNGTGPTSINYCVPYLINKFYRDAGVDCRYILKAYSGSTTTGHENFRAAGKYDFPKVDAIFYNLGINDAAQGYSTATSLANVASLVAWKRKRYPNNRLVICGSTPVQNNTYETTLAAMRSAVSSYVTGLADPSILYHNFGVAFDRTVDANYASSDGAGGTRIHPTDAGLSQLWNGGYNGYGGLAAWLSANLPLI